MKKDISLKVGGKFWTPEGLGAIGMNPHEAVAELVANSIDWMPEKRKDHTPTIQIEISDDRISVIDNAIGMTAEELEDAISIATASNLKREPIRARKGMYGMGMKVACLSLGWNTKIYTKAEGEDEILLELDAREFQKNPDRDQTVYIYTNPKNSPLQKNRSPHGTAIIISDLQHRGINVDASRTLLSAAFSPDIEKENCVILVDNIECRHQQRALIEETNLEEESLEITARDGKKYKIKGFVGLLDKGAHGSGNWGLNLFKENQLIERLHKVSVDEGGLFPQRIHPTHGKVYGEIYLDGCVPSFNKVGFDHQSSEWKEAQKILRNILNDYQTRSKKYRKNDDAMQRRANAQKICRVSEEIRSLIGADEPEIEESQAEGSEGKTSKNVYVIPQDPSKSFTVDFQQPELNTFNGLEAYWPWTWVSHNNTDLVIFYNTEHPAYKIVNKKTEEFLFLYQSFAILDCLRDFLEEVQKFSPHDAQTIAYEYYSEIYKKIEEEGEANG